MQIRKVNLGKGVISEWGGVMIHKSCAILMVGKDGYLLGVYCYCVLDHAQRWIESTVLEVPPGVLPTHYFLPTPSTS